MKSLLKEQEPQEAKQSALMKRRKFSVDIMCFSYE